MLRNPRLFTDHPDDFLHAVSPTRNPPECIKIKNERLFINGRISLYEMAGCDEDHWSGRILCLNWSIHIKSTELPDAKDWRFL